MSIAELFAEARRARAWRRLELIAEAARFALDDVTPTEGDYLAAMEVARRVTSEAAVGDGWEDWEVACLLGACGRVADGARRGWIVPNVRPAISPSVPQWTPTPAVVESVAA